jgi:ABC-type uncharacterized transport system YnjBCD permease subunit
MPRSPAARLAQLVTGVALMIVAPITAPLPGPAATFIFAGGLLLVLRNSHSARMRFARIKRRHPRLGALLDRVMRRSSALRRRERDAARVDL